MGQRLFLGWELSLINLNNQGEYLLEISKKIASILMLAREDRGEKLPTVTEN